jgi:hypothetical protein
MPWHETEYYAARASLGATASATTVALVGVVGLVSLFLIAFGCMWQASVRAKAARVAEAGAETRALRPGYAVVRGKVETEDGQPAIRVSITQRGREWRDKNGLHHSWKEVSRQVSARPFRLVLASGERLRIEPNEDVSFVDELDVTRDLEYGMRERAAELTPGEHAYVSGKIVAPDVVDPYRGAQDGFLIRPARSERMLVSVAPLEERHERRVRLHRRWALGCAVAFLMVNGLAFRGYWQRLTEGQLIAATVTSTRQWTTRSKHGNVQHYGIDATTPLDGRPLALRSEVNLAYWNEVRSALKWGTSPSVPFLIVGSDAATSQIGTRPTLTAVVAVFSWLALAILAAAYAIHSRHARLWYERKRVMEVGGGPLGTPDRLQ